MLISRKSEVHSYIRARLQPARSSCLLYRVIPFATSLVHISSRAVSHRLWAALPCPALPWAPVNWSHHGPSPKKHNLRYVPRAMAEAPVDPWKSPSPLGVGALNLTPAPTLSQARSFTPITPHFHTPINESERMRERILLARPPSQGLDLSPQLIPHFGLQADAAQPADAVRALDSFQQASRRWILRALWGKSGSPPPPPHRLSASASAWK